MPLKADIKRQPQHFGVSGRREERWVLPVGAIGVVRLSDTSDLERSKVA